jgi:hypothetical protein
MKASKSLPHTLLILSLSTPLPPMPPLPQPSLPTLPTHLVGPRGGQGRRQRAEDRLHRQARGEGDDAAGPLGGRALGSMVSLEHLRRKQWECELKCSPQHLVQGGLTAAENPSPALPSEKRKLESPA